MGEGRLGRVPDDRPGSLAASTSDHPPLHGGDVLGLVDENVSEGIARLVLVNVAGLMETIAEGDEFLGVTSLDKDRVVSIGLGGNWAEQSGQLVEQGHIGY